MKLPSLDQRGAIIVAIVLAGLWFPSVILWMVAVNPALLKDASFMQFATLVVTASLGAGGIGTVVTWAFGGTKSGGETQAKLADSQIASAGATTTVTTDPLKVTTTPAVPAPHDGG